MTPRRPRHNRGMTLVELLVGILIGMVVILIVTEVAVTFERQKRSTVGGADALGEGAIGLFNLKREIQQAGYAMYEPALVACNVRAYAEPLDPMVAGSVGVDYSYRLFPLLIEQNTLAGTTPTQSRVTINYASSPMVTTAVVTTTAYTGDESEIKVSNRFGFTVGDAFILANPTPGVQDCARRQITCLPGTPQCDPGDTGNMDVIRHVSSEGTHQTYRDIRGNDVYSRWNKPGGTGAPPAPFAPGSKLFLLGGQPVSKTFEIQNNQLMMTNIQAGPASTPVVLLDNVVMFRAQYGFDTRTAAAIALAGKDDRIVDTYSDFIMDADGDGSVVTVDGAGRPTSHTPGDYMRIGAARIAFVVRSRHPEKPNTAGVCTTTSGPVSFWGGTESFNPATTGPADWACYRYRAFETVIPLRNMVWVPPL